MRQWASKCVRATSSRELYGNIRPAARRLTHALKLEFAGRATTVAPITLPEVIATHTSIDVLSGMVQPESHAPLSSTFAIDSRGRSGVTARCDRSSSSFADAAAVSQP